MTTESSDYDLSNQNFVAQPIILFGKDTNSNKGGKNDKE